MSVNNLPKPGIFRTAFRLFLGGLAGFMIVFLIYKIPAVNNRLSWRFDYAFTYLRGVLEPVNAFPTPLKISTLEIAPGEKPVIFPQETIMGALAYYITHCDESNFQPMKANFGILPDLPVRVKKKLRKEAYANRAIEVMDQFINEL